jgi:hypothetical protein
VDVPAQRGMTRHLAEVAGASRILSVNLCPMATYYVLVAANPASLAKDASLSTSGSNEETFKSIGDLGSCSLRSQRPQRSAAAPTDGQTLTNSGSVAYYSCLLRSSTTYPLVPTPP